MHVTKIKTLYFLIFSYIAIINTLQCIFHQDNTNPFPLQSQGECYSAVQFLKFYFTNLQTNMFVPPIDVGYLITDQRVVSPIINESMTNLTYVH